jgi:hypothetical protein
MLTGVRDAVRNAAKDGKLLAEVQKARPTALWDEKWGRGFIRPDVFVSLIYPGVTAKPRG